MPSPSDPAAIEYQRLPHVARRVREYCGLLPGDRSHCVYVTGMGVRDGAHVTWGDVDPRPPAELAELLDSGADVARSLWDTESLLVYVDIDYMNTDSPGEAFVHPADAFLKLEPTYRGLGELCDELGMPMLDLVTGSGYGFIGRIALHGRMASRLRSLAPEVPGWYDSHDRRHPPWAEARIDEAQARAYHGLGLVLEHLVHRLLALVAPESEIPLVVNNTEVGPGLTGRECVSLDLTHMGDPLDSRFLRVPFGLYQKHRIRPDLVGAAAARLPALVVVPRGRRPLLDVLEQGRTPARAADEAASTHTSIPDVEEGLLRLVEEYAASRLAAWHHDYYAVRPRTHPDTDPGIDALGLPPCVAACLKRPNDLLLKPAHIQLLVRTLLARGWHARHIAGLVAAQYTRQDLWGDHWRRGDPATRADFDVRVFAGLIAAGHDEGVDFNCVSTQEKGMCPGGVCGIDLRSERDRLFPRTRP